MGQIGQKHNDGSRIATDKHVACSILRWAASPGLRKIPLRTRFQTTNSHFNKPRVQSSGHRIHKPKQCLLASNNFNQYELQPATTRQASIHSQAQSRIIRPVQRQGQQDSTQKKQPLAFSIDTQLPTNQA
ncbi:MAG TPA: hypothetical protein QF626_04345 [Prochlorococcaceae cyanobacterium Fu_MAG_50]|nr:hypothetical protein [Prochlorococcaceae cyanobacterium Fu_MAG_50]